MRRLETLEFWPELLALKDALSLRELAEKFSVTPGAISAALKRTGTTRTPAPPGPRSARKRTTDDGDAGSGPPDAPPPPRPGSKDHLITEHWGLLGEVPDAEVAREAGVSVRTVASYRSRHEIPGYSGPRRTSRGGRRRSSRIDAFTHLLGKVADRVVAEQAGVSVNAVRNYRSKRGIAAAPRERARDRSAPTGGTHAWKIVVRQAGADVERVVLADGIRGAVDQADALDGMPVSVSWVGPLVAET